MLAGGDYNNLIRHVRGNYTYDTMDIGTLDALCQAYFETRHYNSFIECSEVLLRKAPKEGLRRTTTNKRKSGVLFGGVVGGLADAYMTEYFTYEDLVAPMLSKRAMISLDFEDYPRAIEASNQAIAYLTRTPTRYPDFLVEAYGVSGLAYALLGDRKNAEARIAGMRAVKIENEDSDLVRRTALLKIYIALKKYDEAKNIMSADTSSSFLKVMNTIDYGYNMTSRTLKNVEIPNTFMMAKVAYETGDWKKAGKYYDALLQNPGFKNLGAALVMALHDRGIMAEKSGQRDETIRLLTQAIDLIELQRSTINSEASKIGFVGDKQAVYHRVVQNLFDDGQYGKAFEYVERSKSRALVDLLATKQDFADRGGHGEEIRTVLAQQHTAEAESQALSPDVVEGGPSTRSIQIKAKAYLQTKAPELASLVTVTSQSVSELQSAIPPGEVLVEYYYRDKEMYVFIVTQDSLKAVKLDSDGLGDDVQAFRKLLGTPQTSHPTELAKKLYLRLFKPIEHDLKSSRLILIPHGVLHYLPMSALHDGTGYLIDRYRIRMMPSASAIKYLQDKHYDKTGGILAFGNPDLGDPRHN
jgi:tetratricopeptide (TPR) repeat protein